MRPQYQFVPNSISIHGLTFYDNNTTISIFGVKINKI